MGLLVAALIIAVAIVAAAIIAFLMDIVSRRLIRRDRCKQRNWPPL